MTVDNILEIHQMQVRMPGVINRYFRHVGFFRQTVDKIDKNTAATSISEMNRWPRSLWDQSWERDF